VPKPTGFPILTVASRDDPHLELVEPSKPARVLDKSPRSPAGMMVNRAFYGAVLLPARRHMRKEGAALAHGPGRGQYLLGKRKVVALVSFGDGPQRVVAKALARLRRVDRTALTAADAVVFLPFLMLALGTLPVKLSSGRCLCGLKVHAWLSSQQCGTGKHCAVTKRRAFGKGCTSGRNVLIVI
jgi:hypothetical protein